MGVSTYIIVVQIVATFLVCSVGGFTVVLVQMHICDFLRPIINVYDTANPFLAMLIGLAIGLFSLALVLIPGFVILSRVWENRKRGR